MSAAAAWTALWIAVAVAHAAAITFAAPVAARLAIIAGVWLFVAAVYAWQIPARGDY